MPQKRPTRRRSTVASRQREGKIVLMEYEVRVGQHMDEFGCLWEQGETFLTRSSLPGTDRQKFREIGKKEVSKDYKPTRGPWEAGSLTAQAVAEAEAREDGQMQLSPADREKKQARDGMLATYAEMSTEDLFKEAVADEIEVDDTWNRDEVLAALMAAAGF